ncbi:MAG: hypothetical protein H0X24_23640, partial [Ktedonobacterales bacterium]|nr:hypothetical protein [Ktedonobacterales bacterium]
VTPVTTHYYGVNGPWIVAAIAGLWPEEKGPYCAVAVAMAVDNYMDETRHLPLRFTKQAQQLDIGKADQTEGASQWGNATPINAAGGVINIAPDRGVDPRGAAYIQAHYAPPNTSFHNYIYRWQFHHATEPSYHQQAMEATTSLYRSWLTHSDPLAVIVNGGEHSVIVSGGWSSDEIANDYPANIQGVIVRDPQFASSVSRFEVSQDQWTNHGVDFGAGYYTLWSRFYGDQPNHTVNHDDPEPTVGIYAPTATDPVHWFHGFSWVQVDSTTGDAANPDWAFSDTGTQLATP